MRNITRRLGVTLAACAALVAACSSSTTSGGGSSAAPPKAEPLSALGDGEGELNLIAWPGYAEDGSNDPKVDWVHPFEQKTGCKVNIKIGNTSDEMVQLMRTGQYDGVSASGDATLRLIYAGDVAPVNTKLVPNYDTISAFLKDKPWNSVERPDVRHSARLGRQPADVQHRRRHERPRHVGCGVPGRAGVQGQGHRV